MNETDFYELQIMHIELLNGHLEIWIGFTFATLISFHLLGRRFNLLLLLLIEFLYLVGSFLFAVRYSHTSSVVGDFNQRLIEAGGIPYPTPHASMFIAMMTLFIIGTIGTVGYGVFAYRSRHDDT